MPHNKGMKLTKPAQAMELRSLSLVFAAFSEIIVWPSTSALPIR
jgi:hypothetical protein